VEAHRKALIAHMMGPPGKPAPRAPEVVEAVLLRVPQAGPVATRGPDKFEIVQYEVFDDTPKTPEQEQAISVLRETING
jgi:DNA-directed RNA polymerase subunit E'/Rpb7